MSSKSTNAVASAASHGRRTPLSLSGGGSKIPTSQQHSVQQNSKVSSSNNAGVVSGSGSNVSNKPNVQKNDKNKNSAHNIKAAVASQPTNVNAMQVEKKDETKELKKVQNGVGDKSNGNVKDNIQNGKEQNSVEKKTKAGKDIEDDKKERADKAEKTNTEQKIETEKSNKTKKEIVDAVDNADKDLKETTIAKQTNANTHANADDAKLAENKQEDDVANQIGKPTNYKPKPACKMVPTRSCRVTAEQRVSTANNVSPRKAINTVASNDIEVAASTKAAIAAAAVPVATSTPGKFDKNKSETLPDIEANYTPDRNNYPRSFSAISGRRSIRSLHTDYSTRETYRKLNTEFDDTCSSSLNVTVGSELPNNSWSFWGLGRKREHISPKHSQTQIETESMTPQKRARTENSSFISFVRSRFSKANMNNKTANGDETVEDEEQVQNFSGSTESDNDNVSMAQCITVADEQKPQEAVEENEKPQKQDLLPELPEKMDISLDKTAMGETEKPLCNAEEQNAGNKKRCILM